MEEMDNSTETEGVVVVPKNLLKGLKRPEKVEFHCADKQKFYARFVAEPFEKGFGVTIGNALRRVLMSYIEGAAVVAIKIDGIDHEFSSIPGIIEDVSRIILNLKRMRIRLYENANVTVQVTKQGVGLLIAGDFNIDSNIEVVNPDLVLAHLTEANASLDITIEIARGRGFVTADLLKNFTDEVGVIPIDAFFSPVRKVKFEASETRVGQRTDYDKLTLDVWTDGTYAPEDIVAYAAKILKEHLTIFINFEEDLYEEEELTEDNTKYKEVLGELTEVLDISVRTVAVLKSIDVKTVGDLICCYEEDLRKSKSYSDKVLLQLKNKLAEKQLSFGIQDID